MTEWQQPVAIAVAASAALLLIRMQVRAYRKKQSRACGQDCGCSAEGNERAGPDAAPPLTRHQ